MKHADGCSEQILDEVSRTVYDLTLKGWLTGFFLGLIVFMGCSLACVHACFF